MVRKADTHVRVTEKTWQRLNRRKGPGDSFDDVIVELLDDDDGGRVEPDGGRSAHAD